MRNQGRDKRSGRLAPPQAFPASTQKATRVTGSTSSSSVYRGYAAIGAAALIAFAASLTYANSLSGVFVLDDINNIVKNPTIRSLQDVARVLRPGGHTSGSGRPLVDLSLALNYAVSGVDVWSYHVFNIAIHILCGLLLFGIVRRTLEAPVLKSSFDRASLSLAFCVGLIWVLHPLNSEVVDYVTQRSESMMGLCALVTIYASIRATASRRSAWWSAVAVFSCACGMACKESMAVIPIAVILYDGSYTFTSMRQAISRRRTFYISLVSTWALLIVLMMPSPRGNTAGFANADGVTAWIYILNQAEVITRYLRLTVWPDNLVAFYGYPRVIGVGAVWREMLFISGLVAAAVIAWVRTPTLGWPALAVFLTLGPTSSVLPIATEVGAERRMYLPLMALIALAVVGLYVLSRDTITRLSGGLAKRRGLWILGGTSVLLILAVACCVRTRARNREYASTVLLARSAVRGWPNGETHELLAKVLLVSGAHDEGLAQYQQALAYVPRTHFPLGLELVNDGANEEGVRHLQATIEIAKVQPQGFLRSQIPSRADALSAREVIGRVYLGQGRWADAQAQFEAIVASDPQNPAVRRLLADALFAQEAFAAAAAQYRVYLEKITDDAGALSNLGIALIATGQPDGAIAAFRRVVTITPEDAGGRRNLANALADAGITDEAVVQATAAVRLAPMDRGAQDLLTRLLARQRKR